MENKNIKHKIKIHKFTISIYLFTLLEKNLFRLEVTYLRYCYLKERDF